MSVANGTADRLHIDAIDVGYLGLEGAAAAFVVRRQGAAGLGAPILVECGTAANQPRLRAGLARLGIDGPIDTLLLTHIHLDHAGGAGHWAAAGADVYVHPFGVRHLADPAKLIASSRRVHGAAYDLHYGDPLPCAPERLHAVSDGERIVRHGISCTAIETPGHARHHHAWLLAPAEVNGAGTTLFAGDIAAMRTPGSRHISVPTPPPEFDHLAWQRSLERLRELRPTELWLTHLGPVGEPLAHLAEVRERLDAEVDELSQLLRAIDGGLSEAEALDRYRAWLWPQAVAKGVTEERLSSFLGHHFGRMNLAGLRRWRETQGAAAGG